MPTSRPTLSTARTRRVRQAVPVVNTDEVLEELKQLKAALAIYRKLLEKLQRELAAA